MIVPPDRAVEPEGGRVDLGEVRPRLPVGKGPAEVVVIEEQLLRARRGRGDVGVEPVHLLGGEALGAPDVLHVVIVGTVVDIRLEPDHVQRTVVEMVIL